MIDLVALLALAAAGWWGWRRGTLLAALSVAGLMAGYVVSWLFYRPLGRIVAALGTPLPIAYAIGGVAALAITSIVLSVVARRVAKARAADRAEGWTPTGRDKAGGAALGVVWGAGIVFIVAWGAMALGSLRGGRSSIEGTLVGGVTSNAARELTYHAVKSVVGDPFIATMVSIVAGQPGTGAAAAKVVLSDPRIHRLWTDPVLRQALANRDLAALERDPGIQSLSGDADFRRAAQQIGLVGTQRGVDAFAQNLIANVGPMVRAVQTLEREPATQQLLHDPKFAEFAKNGNLPGMMASSQFNQLGSRLVEILKQNAKSMK